MSSPVDRRRAAPVPARRAFTLVELVIVVMVLGVLTGVAAPRLLDLSQGAQVAAIVRHLRVGEDAALRYYAEHGRYPADASRGVMPPELSDYLPADFFSRPVPGGGKYDWNGEGLWGDVYCGIGIFKYGPPVGLWQAIDDAHDDGDLSTGKITMYSGNTLQVELVPLP